MMRVYLSLHALRLYVACLVLRVLKVVKREGGKRVFELVLDRAAAEKVSATIREQRLISEKSGLPLVIRRTNKNKTLHLSVVLREERHSMQMEHLSYPKHKIHFQVTNPLGLSKALMVDITECTSMLTANELQELFQYVQTRGTFFFSM